MQGQFTQLHTHAHKSYKPQHIFLLPSLPEKYVALPIPKPQSSALLEGFSFHPSVLMPLLRSLIHCGLLFPQHLLPDMLLLLSL